MPRDMRWVAFIDMNKIHELNEELGYTEVDRRMKETFSVPFRRSDVVARWYSGDEIVILFDADEGGAERKIEPVIDRLFLWRKRNAYRWKKYSIAQGSLPTLSL